MSENPPSPPPPPPLPNPSEDRRNRAAGSEDRNLRFADRKLTSERLEALKAYLKDATPDDIEVIRNCYGENPEVLKLIGLEGTLESAEDK